MLVAAIVVLLLFALAFLAVGVVARAAMRRLGLELEDVLLWLGLAEDRRGDESTVRAGPLVSVEI